MNAAKITKLVTLLGEDVSGLSTPYVGPFSGLEGISGVYIIVFDSKYLYVGKAKNLERRIGWHLSRNSGEVTTLGGVSKKYHDISDSHRISHVFVVDHGNIPERVLASRESLWIGVVHKLVGDKLLANISYSGTDGQKRAQNRSPEVRAAQAARMSRTIKSMHKDPVYKAKMKEIARQNYANVDPLVREAANRATSIALKARFADPRNKEFMAEKVRNQWKDPKFRQANRERLKRIQEEVRNGTRTIKRQLHTCKVTFPLANSNQSRVLFEVETTTAMRLFQLPSTSDLSPEKKLPKILQGAVRIVRNDPKPGDLRSVHAVSLVRNAEELAEHPFVTYVQRFRSSLGSYRVKPALVRSTEGSLLRVPSLGSSGTRKGLTLVKQYDNLWSFWKDAEKYPMKRMEQL
jgi:hypothetical protein